LDILFKPKPNGGCHIRTVFWPDVVLAGRCFSGTLF
jgi:hypothetical protein